MKEAKTNGRILIVEDEANTISLLTNLLDSDYDLYVITNGKDALKIAKDILPDIILLDIGLSGKTSGYGIIKQLKSDDEFMEIPTIFITDDSTVDEIEKLLQLGGVDYISKPISLMIAKLRIDREMKIIEQTKLIAEQTELASYDHLTNLFNRRFFDLQMDKEWKRAIREKTESSLLLIDIDYFKKYNDKYGHLQGDVALKAVANACREAAKRPSDFVARWGGEEFAILLPVTDKNGACKVAEKTREFIENTVILAGDIETRITVSVGVSTCAPVRDGNIKTFMENADNALYKAKEHGRNRVEFYD